MTLPRLNLRPDQTNYTVAMGTALVVQQLAGGPPRSRIDVYGQWEHMTVQWTVDMSGYEYLQQCYRYTEANGGAHFTIDLILNHGLITVDCEAMFVPGTFQLKSTAGLSVVVGAEIWVAPQVGDDVTWPVDSDLQDALLTDIGTPIII